MNTNNSEDRTCFKDLLHVYYRKINQDPLLTVMPSAPSCFCLMAMASFFFSALVCWRTSSILATVAELSRSASMRFSASVPMWPSDEACSSLWSTGIRSAPTRSCNVYFPNYCCIQFNIVLFLHSYSNFASFLNSYNVIHTLVYLVYHLYSDILTKQNSTYAFSYY